MTNDGEQGNRTPREYKSSSGGSDSAAAGGQQLDGSAGEHALEELRHFGERLMIGVSVVFQRRDARLARIGIGERVLRVRERQQVELRAGGGHFLLERLVLRGRNHRI